MHDFLVSNENQTKTFFLKGDPRYNAYEWDIAVVNLFFPDSTAFGLSSLPLSIIHKRVVWQSLNAPPR